MTIRCEDYPCCGHTPGDPCDKRSIVDEPWYCDQCGFNHAGFMVSCPADEVDEPEDDDDCCSVGDANKTIHGWVCAYCGKPVEAPYDPMEDQWLDGSYEE